MEGRPYVVKRSVKSGRPKRSSTPSSASGSKVRPSSKLNSTKTSTKRVSKIPTSLRAAATAPRQPEMVVGSPGTEAPAQVAAVPATVAQETGEPETVVLVVLAEMGGTTRRFCERCESAPIPNPQQTHIELSYLCARAGCPAYGECLTCNQVVEWYHRMNAALDS